MDRLARENGLGHWSCVSPKSYSMWLRSDGAEFSKCYFSGHFSYQFVFGNYASEIELITKNDIFEALHKCDKECPVGEDWQKPKDHTSPCLCGLVNPAETEHWAEEYECAMMFLDSKNVPRQDGNGVLSIVGRINCIFSKQPTLVQKPFDVKIALDIENELINGFVMTKNGGLANCIRPYDDGLSYCVKYPRKGSSNFLYYCNSLGQCYPLASGKDDYDLIIFVWE